MKGRPALLVGLVVPAMLSVVVVLGWTAWSSSGDRDRIARTAANANLGNAVTEAQTQLSLEMSYLLSLRGVNSQDVPGYLLPAFARTGTATLESIGRNQMIAFLDDADRKGRRALEDLRNAGFHATPAMEQALSSMPGGARSVVDAARGTAGLPLESYERAFNELLSAMNDTRARSAGALQELSNLGRGSTKWLEPGFLGLGLGLLIFVAGVAATVAWRVSRRVERAETGRDLEHERAEALARRNTRLLAMVDASRRVTAGSDLASVAGAVAEEAQELLLGSASAVFLLDDANAAHPVARAGMPVAATIRAHEGVVGRAMDTGLPARTIVASDPAFPDASGGLSLVVAPLLAGRRVTGAIVVATPDAPLADDEDELTLKLIALAAGTAIEAARAHDTTARLAHTDPLTGLANRRRLDGDLSVIGDAVGGQVSFLMIDVDHFKAFNDAHGHPAGDTLLKQVADTVRSCVRDSDVVYRFGGEEFAVLLRGATEKEARAVASRVRSEVAHREFSGGESQPGGRVTVSVGVARGREGDQPADLVLRADDALYRAKRDGRDRVVVSD